MKKVNITLTVIIFIILIFLNCSFLNNSISEIKEVSSITLPYYPGYGLEISGDNNELYVTQYTDGDSMPGLYILDISDKTEPAVIGELWPPSTYGLTSAIGVEVIGDIAYLITEYQGFYSIDISDKTSPVILDKFDEWSEGFLFDIQDNLAYISDNDRIHIIDISNIEDMKYLISISVENCTDIILDDDIAYFQIKNYENNGIKIADISDVHNITIIDSFIYSHTPEYQRSRPGMELIDNVLFSCEGDSGLFTFDITKSSEISILSKYRTDGSIISADVSNDYIYLLVAQEEHTYYSARSDLEILDVSDPANPNKICEEKNLNAHNIIINNEYGFANCTGEIRILQFQ